MHRVVLIRGHKFIDDFVELFRADTRRQFQESGKAKELGRVLVVGVVDRVVAHYQRHVEDAHRWPGLSRALDLAERVQGHVVVALRTLGLDALSPEEVLKQRLW